MSSAASLEALINELFIAHDGKLRARMSDFETEFWGSKGIERKKPMLIKYQLALAMLNVSKFNQKASPYREASALVELRNALVHHKPTWDRARGHEVELAEVLKGRFLVSPFPDEAADFVTMKCMSHGCASWAVETVVAFTSAFDARTELDPKKMQAFLACGA